MNKTKIIAGVLFCAAMIGCAAKARRGRVDDMTVAVIQIEEIA